MKPSPVLVGVDTGGTFTDLVALVGGELRVLKVPSTPRDPAAAVRAGLTALVGGAGRPRLHYGSTVATNALLERRGARVVLLTTEG
ncbi:MAG: hydantoinase/oxoprolinase family protein, partial [Deltaproteobacteria bacterium]